MTPYVICVDAGSTFTKGLSVAVDQMDAGTVLAHAQVPTTIGSGQQVTDGVDAVVAHLTDAVGWAPGEIQACSSAGGGLRLAVIGYERVITSEAASRVALSAGARVVETCAGLLDTAALQQLVDRAPDLLLLVGGTDGGNSDVIVANAAILAASAMRVPIVVAGNNEVTAQIVATLTAANFEVASAANVLPSIGTIAPYDTRATIRASYIRHVIGGRFANPAFTSIVRGATPDLVLRGVEVLAAELGHDVLVVDVGGATTDVYSVLERSEQAPREAVEPMWQGRTVEGDLGMRWGATGVIDAAARERLSTVPELADWAARVHADIATLPLDWGEQALDAQLAALAATVAVRRHARSGRDLAEVRQIVLSGGVFRHLPPPLVKRSARTLTDDHGGGWRVPVSPMVHVDSQYVLAAAGLLAADYPTAAARLVASFG